MSNHYNVSVHREDGYWVAVTEGVRGGATESRKLGALEAEIRDLLGGLLDVDGEQLLIEFNLEQALGVPATKAIKNYDEAREALETALNNYEFAQRDAVEELRNASVSLRDSAGLLGLSFQRVQQLAKA